MIFDILTRNISEILDCDNKSWASSLMVACSLRFERGLDFTLHEFCCTVNQIEYDMKRLVIA